MGKLFLTWEELLEFPLDNLTFGLNPEGFYAPYHKCPKTGELKELICISLRDSGAGPVGKKKTS